MLISRGSIFIHETIAFTSQRDIIAMVIEVQTRLATELTASRNNSKVDSKPERKQKRGVKDAKIKSPICLILRISSPRLQPRWIFCDVRSKNTGCDSTFGTKVRNQPILPLGKSSVVIGLLKLLILPLILSCNAVHDCLLRPNDVLLYEDLQKSRCSVVVVVVVCGNRSRFEACLPLEGR
jgi:hypothetical protein